MLFSLYVSIMAYFVRDFVLHV